MRLQRVVCPTLTGISAADDNSLASEPQRPHIRRVRIVNTGSIVSGVSAVSKSTGQWTPSGWILLVSNVWIAFYSGDVREFFFQQQRSGDLAAALHQDRVHNVKGAMLDAALSATEPLKDRPLCCLGSCSLARRKRSDPSQPWSLRL